MHLKRLGKRQGFANEAAEALAKCVVEALHVVRRTPFGVARVMLAGRQDVVIALQVVGIQSALAVRERDACPQQAGGRIIARAQRVGHDLASASA